MSFDVQKKDTLARKDRSKSGKVDGQLTGLLDSINSSDSLYTTSSCAGRIVLLHNPTEEKQNCEWLMKEHREVELEEMLTALKDPPAGRVWLRMESFILHVCCKDMKTADSFMKAAREAGFKHSGITGITPRIMIEIMGTESMSCLVADEGAVIVDENYLKTIISIANRKLSKNYSKISKLKEKIEALSAS